MNCHLRAPTIPGFKRTITKIEKAELRIERKRTIQFVNEEEGDHTKCIARKISEYSQPYVQFVLPKGVVNGKGFTEEHDRFLLFCMAQVRDGNPCEE